MRYILLFLLTLISGSIYSQTKIEIITDSSGFKNTYQYNVEFIAPYCVKCNRVACIWSNKWYCKKHYKKLKRDKNHLRNYE